MSPQRQKEETVTLLVDIIAQVAGCHASVVLFEDAHWADPSTVEALDALIDRVERLPLLVLITFRPEFRPLWTARPHVTLTALTRLSRAQGASIVLQIAENKPMPAALVAQIVDKTDGVPLFLEELTKTVLESDLLIEADGRYDYSSAGSKISIPATLRDSLMARLDRLIPVKEIAQIGAVLGREFNYELVRTVSPMSEAQLREALDKLTASQLVYCRGTLPGAIYMFKHALVQDTAYDSLLKSKRQALHAQIAAAIGEHFPSKAELEPELLAHHYTEAGMTATALPYWRKAGRLAQERVALREAIRHYERALELTSGLAPSTERDAFELELRALLGMAWVALHGYTHPQVAANLTPALALEESLDGGEYTLRILWGLWVYTLCRGQVEESLVWAERLIETAEQRDSQSMRHAGHWAACDSHYFLGNFARCIYHADVILANYEAERDRPIADLINHDPKTIALAYKAGAEWRLGFADTAAATAQAAISHSAQRGHIFDFCWVRAFLTHTRFSDCGDTAAMASSLDQAEPMAAEQKLVFFTHVYCPLSRAFWLLRSDRLCEAETEFSEVIPKWVGAGMEIYLPTIKALHAASLLGSRNVPCAMRLLDEALDQIKRPGYGERAGLSEVLRIKACALIQAGRVGEAEEMLREAMEIARSQNAKFWELRTATDLARLLNAQGRQAEVLEVLRTLYCWFTEGHHTQDLREAAALLTEMGVLPSVSPNLVSAGAKRLCSLEQGAAREG